MSVFDKNLNRLLGSLALDAGAGITNPDRNRAATRLAGNGYAGPVIVAEGDSWFCYPTIVRKAPLDIISQLGKRYVIYTEAKPGDLAQTMRSFMRSEGGLLAKLEHRRPQILMLSAGGNDLFGDGRLDEHLPSGDRTITDYLKGAAYSDTFWRVVDSIDDMARSAIRQHPALKVVVHGYDVTIPTGKGPWLQRPMNRLGIPANKQDKIVKRIVDQFNTAIGQLARKINTDLGRQAIHYIDLRGTLRSCHWSDELHPRSDGFGLICNRFADEIRRMHP